MQSFSNLLIAMQIQLLYIIEFVDLYENEDSKTHIVKLKFGNMLEISLKVGLSYKIAYLAA